MGDVERSDEGAGIHSLMTLTWVGDVERFSDDGGGLGSIGVGRSRGKFPAAGGGGECMAAAATAVGG